VEALEGHPCWRVVEEVVGIIVEVPEAELLVDKTIVERMDC
jgi:hypothetical protein